MRSELHLKRLVLRPLRDTDGPDIMREASDPLISRFTPVPYPYTEAHSESFLNYARTARERKTGFVMGLTLPPGDNVIGLVEIGAISRKDRRGEIGYWMGKEHRRQGLMNEAILGTLEFGFRDLNLHRIHAYVDPQNVASIRLIEQVGFSLEGLLRDFDFHDGAYRHRYLYAMLENEWKNKGAV